MEESIEKSSKGVKKKGKAKTSTVTVEGSSGTPDDAVPPFPSSPSTKKRESVNEVNRVTLSSSTEKNGTAPRSEPTDSSRRSDPNSLRQSRTVVKTESRKSQRVSFAHQPLSERPEKLHEPPPPDVPQPPAVRRKIHDQEDPTLLHPPRLSTKSTDSDNEEVPMPTFVPMDEIEMKKKRSLSKKMGKS